MDDEKFSKLPPEIIEKHFEIFQKDFSESRAQQESTGVMYLRNLVFMNGGALVAVLSARAALIASKSNEVNQVIVEWTWWPMVWFFFGLIFAASLNCSKYLRFVFRGHKLQDNFISYMNDEITHDCFKKKKTKLNDFDKKWFKSEIILGCLGLFCFIVGGILAFYQLT